jgi:hypothetical protein
MTNSERGVVFMQMTVGCSMPPGRWVAYLRPLRAGSALHDQLRLPTQQVQSVHRLPDDILSAVGGCFTCQSIFFRRYLIRVS